MSCSRMGWGQGSAFLPPVSALHSVAPSRYRTKITNKCQAAATYLVSLIAIHSGKKCGQEAEARLDRGAAKTHLTAERLAYICHFRLGFPQVKSTLSTFYYYSAQAHYCTLCSWLRMFAVWRDLNIYIDCLAHCSRICWLHSDFIKLTTTCKQGWKFW